MLPLNFDCNDTLFKHLQSLGLRCKWTLNYLFGRSNDWYEEQLFARVLAFGCHQAVYMFRCHVGNLRIGALLFRLGTNFCRMVLQNVTWLCVSGI